MKQKSICNYFYNLDKTKKIIISVLYFILSFLFVFLISNYYNFINNTYDVKSVFNEINLIEEDNKKVYTYKGDINKVKSLYVNYYSDSNTSMNVYYSLTNNDEIKYEKNVSDECSKIIDYNILKVNKSINNIVITVDKDVEVKDIIINCSLTFNIYLYVFLIVIFFILIAYIYTKNNKDKITVLFFTIFISIGTLIIIFTPTTCCCSWDDQIHFGNVVDMFASSDYKYSKAEQVTIEMEDSFYLYNNQYENKIHDKKMNELDNETTQLFNSNRTFTYYSFIYFPNYIVYNLLKHIGLSYSFRFRLMKIINLVLFALIIAYAIKIIPKFKSMIYLVGLMPVALFLFSNYSYDGIIISFSILAFALFVKMINDNKVQNKDIRLYFILITIMSLIKLIYGPLMLLVFFIPNEKFKDMKTSKRIKCISFIMMLVSMSFFLLPSLINNNSISDSRGGTNVSVGGQLKWIIGNPITFAAYYIKNVIKSGFDLIFSQHSLFCWAYYGESIGILPYLLMYFNIIIVYLSCCNDKVNLEFKKRLYIILIVILIILMTFMIMYLSYNNVGSSIINGVQPRYIIPLYLFMMYSLINKNIKYKISNNRVISIITKTYFIIYIYQFVFTFLKYI